MSNKFIPNSFQVPNVLVDEYISELSSHSFKLLLFIIRKTKGWQKTKDSISTTQLAKVLGVKKLSNVYPYIKELEEYNLIKVYKSLGKTNQYALGRNFDKPLPKKGTTVNESSPKKGDTPVPNTGTGSSPKKGYSTKGTIKTTNNKAMFYDFCERYNGIKREPNTEYEAFKKMHQDWQEVLPKLEGVILKTPADERFIPSLKNYLERREWESAKRVKVLQWWETRQGTVEKGMEYGMEELDYGQFHQFRAAVVKKVKENGELVA